MKRHTIYIEASGFMSAKFNLSLEEHRLLTYLSMLVQENDGEFKEYEIGVMKYCAFMGLRLSSHYGALRKACAALEKKEVYVFESNDPKFEKLVSTRWLTKYHYYPQEGRVGVSVASPIKRYLIQWYTVIFMPDSALDGLDGLNMFRSTYSFRLYEILKPYLLGRGKTCEITVHSLRWLLDLDTEYSSYSEFKTKVLLTAQQELLEKSDIAFEFTEIKKSRRIDRLIFNVRWKRPRRMKKAVKKKQPAQIDCEEEWQFDDPASEEK